MTARQIVQALQDNPLIDPERHSAAAEKQDAQASEAARAGFLEWMISLPDGANPANEARLALIHLDAVPCQSAALRQFAGYLREACVALPSPVRRGGIARNRRFMH